MRRGYQRDPDYPDFADEEQEQRNDLVLGAPALLGIFFALALICAVCFGFGYSSGHDLHLGTSTASATEQETAAIPSAHTPMPITPAPEPAETANAAGSLTEDRPLEQAGAAKPAPGASASASQYWPSGDPQPGQQTAAEAPPMPHARAAAATTLPPATGTPGIAKPSPGAPATGTVAAADAATEALPGAGLMVQIAAVSRAADANTLATALRHDGFAAIVRTATGDPLFHVQVGPFPSFSAAKAMRGRLADNGYNAFIKP